jgi:Stage II sporulation protein E (SpoIIE)
VTAPRPAMPSGGAPPAAAPRFSTGGYSRPLAGFAECGDAFVICGRGALAAGAGGLAGAADPADPAGAPGAAGPAGALLVAVVDGLGHGKEAGVAAQAAARIVREHPELQVDELVRRCDRELQPTRGAAVGVLRVREDGRGEFCGIGNIEVQILAGQPPGLFCLPGIVGHNLRTVRAMPFTMRAGDIYCLHSDGVSGRGNLHGCLPGTPEAVARCIVERWGRLHDDATAVVLGYGAGARLPAPEVGAGPESGGGRGRGPTTGGDAGRGAR